MFKLFALILALMAAGPANAGPVAGVFAIISTTIKTSAILTALSQLAIGVVLSAVARKLGPKMKGHERQANVQLDVQLGDDQPLSIVVGNYATAGKRKYIGSWGKNTRFITDVIEVSALPQGDLMAIWVDDIKGNIDRSTVGWVEGPAANVEQVNLRGAGAGGAGVELGYVVDTYKLEGRKRIWVRWVNGEQTAVDPFLSWAFAADEYPWDGVGRGKTYAIITSQYDEDVQTSLPSFVLEPTPLPMYDPRKDGSTGGSGSHRWGDRSTYEPTSNGAVIAYNVARGIYYGDEWVFGGKNLPAWRLPRAEWVAAMNACDRQIAVSDGSFEAAYRCGYEIRVDDIPADALEDLGKCCNMRFSEVGGLLKPYVDLPITSVFSITDEDVLITEGQSYQPFFPMVQTFNALSATYPEPFEKWTTRDAPEHVDVVAQVADGGRYLPTSVTYPMCPFPNQVQRLMRSQLSDYRRMAQHTFTLSPEAMHLEPLDMISWSSNRNGYINKKFIVEEISRLPNFCCVVALREVDPSDYDWTPSFELPYTLVPPASIIPAPQGITGWAVLAVMMADNNGRNRKPAVKVSCGGNEVGVTDIRVQILKDGAVMFDFTRPYDEPYEWYITDLVPQTTYMVRGALISRLTGRYDWSAPISVTTLAETIWTDQLSDEIWDSFEEIAAQGGIKGVDALPPTGDFADQVVMLRTTKTLYRWDEPSTSWSTSIYAGVADSSISSAKIIAGNIISSHIASSAILTTHLAAGQVTADKMSVGTLSAITANVGLLRTATSGARMEIHGDMLLVYDAGGTLRVRLGRLV